MKQINLSSGKKIPVFGLGTWRMGEHQNQFANEADALRSALENRLQVLAGQTPRLST